MPCQFNGSGFMNGNMSAVGAEDALVGSKEGIDYRGIGLGSADQKFHLRIGTLADFSDFFFGGSANAIAPIARIGISVLFGQAF